MMRIETEELSEDQVLLKLIGKLDEDSKLDEMNQPNYKTLILDLEELQGLNSSGIRTWIQWVQSVSAHQEVRFRHCPYSMCYQAGIMSNFVPKNSKLDSFLVPYFCAHCENEFSLTAVLDQHFKRNSETQELEVESIPNVLPCTACSEEAQMDATPKRYFSFLKYF